MNWQQACELPYYGGSDLGANPAAATSPVPPIWPRWISRRP